MRTSIRFFRPALALLCVLLFVAPWTWLPKPFALELELRTSRAVQLNLFYTGENSPRAAVTLADSRGVFKRYRLPIDSSVVKGLRLHVSPEAVVDFRHLGLKPLGQAAIPIGPEELKPFGGSCVLQTDGDVVRAQPVPGAGGFDFDLQTSALPIRHARRLEGFVFALFCCSALALLWLTRRGKAPLDLSTLWHRFSRLRPRRVVLASTFLFAAMSLAKLNGSSSGLWRFYADGRLPDHRWSIGDPKDIRSDEWMVQTPWILSQVNTLPSFSPVNRNFGDGKTALLVNVPVRHWSTIFRPQFWGFFVVNLEHAFAWYWNLKWYVLIVGGYLFFRLVARGNSALALAGATLVFFSSYIQWWYSTGACLPELLGMVFLGLWGFRVMLRGTTPTSVIAAAVLVGACVENFILCCYPRFQIPLLYFAAITGLWLLIKSPPRASHRALRYVCLTAVLSILVVLNLLWFAEVAPLLRETSQLDYPGRVFSVGGGFDWQRFFVPYLLFGMSEFHFPQALVNACNAAGFFLLLPLVVVLLACRRSLDGLVLGLLGFTAAVIYFMCIGVPPAVARYSGWSLVYDTRGILPVGIAMTSCLVRLMASPARRRSFSLFLEAGALVLLVFASYEVLVRVNDKYDRFVSPTGLVMISAYLAVLILACAARPRWVALTLLLIPTFVSTALVNPIGCGLPGFVNSPIFSRLREVVKSDQSGRWIVTGDLDFSYKFPHFIKAAGADALGGIRCNPDGEVMAVLDPDRKYFDAWNRFALTRFVRTEDESPKIVKTSSVSYDVSVPFTSQWLDRIQVRYIVQTGPPEMGVTVPGYSVSETEPSFQILSRRVMAK